MKHLKRFNESLLSVSVDEIDDYLVDLLQSGFKSDIQVGSSYIIDFNQFKSKREVGWWNGYHISSNLIDEFTSGTTNNSLTISLKSKNKNIECNIDDAENTYKMLSNFLRSEYGLVPNYIMIHGIGTFRYFQNFDDIRSEYSEYVGGVNTFPATDIVFGFYKRD